MQHQPPAVFIDATGPTSWFFNDPKAFRFEEFPEIASFIHAHYVHLADLYGQRYFLRRDLATAREALFNISLPRKACDPDALRCLSTPTTLPVQLAPVRFPEHASVQAEFVPVQSQMGPATVMNTEAVPNSYRGLRFQHTTDDQYVLIIGTGQSWIFSKEFTLPVQKPVSLTIDFNGNIVSVKCNSQRDELRLPAPMANSLGPIDINSWIESADPFIGKMQFFQILDLTE
jgi:hypothetical protein